MSIKFFPLTAACLSLLAANPILASENPFLPKAKGELLQVADAKCGGATASGAETQAPEGKCDTDMKCGEGKCGSAMMPDEDEDEAKCGGADKPAASDGANSKCGGAH